MDEWEEKRAEWKKWALFLYIFTHVAKATWNTLQMFHLSLPGFPLALLITMMWWKIMWCKAICSVSKLNNVQMTFSYHLYPIHWLEGIISCDHSEGLLNPPNYAKTTDFLSVYMSRESVLYHAWEYLAILQFSNKQMLMTNFSICKYLIGTVRHVYLNPPCWNIQWCGTPLHLPGSWCRRGRAQHHSTVSCGPKTTLPTSRGFGSKFCTSFHQLPTLKACLSWTEKKEVCMKMWNKTEDARWWKRCIKCTTDFLSYWEA